MKKITLICAAGMSTNLLVRKMKDAAAAQKVEAEIEAMSIDSFAETTDKPDILLLAPQVSYRLSEVKGMVEPRGIKVALINMSDYGLLDGKKVLAAALDLIQ